MLSKNEITNKLIINKNLNGKPSNDDKINTLGFSSIHNKELSNNELFSKSLKRFGKTDEEITIKIRKVFELFQESTNIEIIQKSSSGKKFSNFIDPEKISKPKAILSNIAFIARFDEPIKENQTFANAIILTVDFIREGLNNAAKFYALLKGIEVIDIQEENYHHPKVLKINSKIKLLDFDTNMQNCLIARQDLRYINGLDKSLDIWGKNKHLDALRLKSYKATIKNLKNFLIVKKKNVFSPYLIAEKDEEFEEGERGILHLLLPADYKFNEDKNQEKFIIGTPENTNMLVIVKSFKLLRFNDLINKEKQELDSQITIKKHFIENLDNEKKFWIKTLFEDKRSKIIIDEKVRENELQIAFFQKKEDELQLELQKINLKIEILKKEKSENVETNINLLTTKIEKHIEKIKLLNKELEVHKKNCEEFQEKHNLKLEKQSNLNANIIKTNENINKNEKKIKITNDQIEDLANEKTLLDNRAKKIENEKLAIFQVNVFGAYDKYGRDSVKKITFAHSQMKDLIFGKKTEYTFSDFDAGLFEVINRYAHTFNAYQFGSFKSPYAALSLDKPHVNIKIKKNIIAKGIQLNENQQKALNATANAHFASFLQGPPGTGKTQVISASIISATERGENIVLSSSTNTAIDNAMERLNRNMDNPNIIMLRYSRNKEILANHPEFSSNALYKSFLKRMDGFVFHSSSSLDDNDLKQIKLIKEHKDFLKLYVRDKDVSLEEIKKASIEKLKKMYLLLTKSNFSVADDEYLLEDITSAIDFARKKLLRGNNKELTEYIDNFILKNKKIKYDILDTLDTYLLKFEQNNSNDSFVTLIQNINKDMERKNKNWIFENYKELFRKKSDDFAKLAFETDTINVIGITTTSKLEVGITQSKSRRELFADYKVDFAIIDEISKSITPEILSIAKLARKFMFAGDYRQLPPQFKMESKLIEEFRKYIFKSDKEIDKELKGWAEEGSVIFKKKINSLFKNSLFTNQVKKMKDAKNLGQTSYQALTEQYRFNKSISSIVNFTYDYEEQLTTVFKDSHFNKYQIGSQKSWKDFVNIVDTSRLTKNFINKIKDKLLKKLSLNDESFDQNFSLLTQKEYFSKVSDFNAYVVIEILKDILTSNKISPQSIGVISMTRSQAQLISTLIHWDEQLLNLQANKIKIDTVDNFQGQEREIVILDLVRGKNSLENKQVIIKKSRDLSFYEKPERINVAVSRAKAKLIIVGAIEEYLAQEVESIVEIDGKNQSIKLFNKWLSSVKKQGGFIRWKEY